MAVCGWGYLDLSAPPEALAELAVSLCAAHSLDGYIADAEAEYEGAGFGLLRRFLIRFRRLAPRAPLAVSGMGAAYHPWVRELDYPAVVSLADVFMPQAYPNEYGDVYTVANCVAHADRAGVPRPMVVPTLGTYPGRYGYTVEGYCAALQAAGTFGLNVFLGSTAAPGELTRFGQEIERRSLAAH